MTTAPIRVMLVDDHAMVRRGLATFLKVHPDLALVGEAETGEEAIRLCGQLLPDVLLMDLAMPTMDGTTATRAIRKQFPTVRVCTSPPVFSRRRSTKSSTSLRIRRWPVRGPRLCATRSRI